jgi:hypothetical protein
MQDHPLSDTGFRQYMYRFLIGIYWEDALDVHGSGPRDVQSETFSAFIVSIRGRWFLVTAGHVLEWIRDRISSGRKYRASILDLWADTSRDQNPIPFSDISDFDRAPWIHIDSDDGLDYGCWYLRDYYCDLLKHNGITPINECAWQNPPAELDLFLATGFPADKRFPILDSGGQVVGWRLSPEAIPLRRENNPPESAIREFDRLYFWPPANLDGSLMDLHGVSGGPVFGFQFTDVDTRMWLVGLQSGQLEECKLATVCPTERFLALIQEKLDD